MRTPPSYEELTANFDWHLAEQELGYRPGDPINIAWMCCDRICKLGLANKLALLWEDYQGNKKKFTYDNIRILSNTIAHFLSGLGIRPGERVCLFLDRLPELYIGFLGILKMGAVAQPLFSAFGFADRRRYAQGHYASLEERILLRARSPDRPVHLRKSVRQWHHLGHGYQS